MEFIDDRNGKGLYSVINGVRVYFSAEDKDKIILGCEYVNGEITETEEYLNRINIIEIEKIKAEKAKAIDNIASLSDQLNLTAGTLDIIVDLLAVNNPELLTNPWIIESKAKLEAIKTILLNNQ